MNFKNLSVKKKLILLQLLVVFAVLVLLQRLSFPERRPRPPGHHQHQARLHGEHPRIQLHVRPELPGRRGRRPDAARPWRPKPHVTHAWILDASGEVFAAYTKPGRSPEPPPVAGAATPRRRRAGRSSCRAASSRTGRSSAPSSCATTWAPTGRCCSAISGLAGLALLGSMGIALLLALFSHRALSAPILRLVEIIGHVSRTKDLSIRIREDRARTRSASSTGASTTCWPRSRTGKRTGTGPWRRSARARKSTARWWRTRRTASSSSRTSASPTPIRASWPCPRARAEELIGTPFTQHVAEEEVPKLAQLL